MKAKEAYQALQNLPDNKRFGSSLKVVKIPNNVKWEIEEYDGSEWVSEKRRTWR